MRGRMEWNEWNEKGGGQPERADGCANSSHTVIRVCTDGEGGRGGQESVCNRTSVSYT